MTKVVAFAGRKQSGKTSSCEFVSKLFTDQYYKHRASIDQNEPAPIGLKDYYEVSKIYNFADPLKQMCMDIFGITYDQCYGSDESKNELVNCYWPKTNAEMTAREVMQYVGTDIFRSMQHNVWADATIRRIEHERMPFALIADCRFPNEVEAVKNIGGIVIKLNRNLYESNHASEIALDEEVYDQSNFDFIVNNNNTNLEEKNNLIYNFLKSKGEISL